MSQGLAERRRIPGRPGLWYTGPDRRLPVPAWAEGLIELGAAAVRERHRELRLVAAVVVPTRSYAAVFSAVGAVGAYVTPTLKPTTPSEAELEQHFQRLRGLRPGTTVTVGPAQRVGSFIGIDESAEEPYVVIRQKKPDFVQKLPLRSCHLVGVSGRSLGVLVIGRINALEAEITGEDVCTAQLEPLQAVLKVSRFNKKRDKVIHSAVLPVGGDLPEELQDALPALVVFDGGSPFRHWREAWRSAPWLVVLDRSAPTFDEGVALVEDEYVQRNTAERSPELPVPEGIELMAFWTAR